MTEKYFSSLERQDRRENDTTYMDLIGKPVMFIDASGESFPR